MPPPKKTNTIKVSITTPNNNNPPTFSFDPPNVDVDHKFMVEWVKDEAPPAGYNTNFDFAAVAFASTNPLANVVIHRNEISAIISASHTTRISEQDIEYSVLVSTSTTASTTYYSSLGHAMTAGGDPTIRNH